MIPLERHCPILDLLFDLEVKAHWSRMFFLRLARILDLPLQGHGRVSFRFVEGLKIVGSVFIGRYAEQGQTKDATNSGPGTLDHQLPVTNAIPPWLSEERPADGITVVNSIDLLVQASQD